MALGVGRSLGPYDLGEQLGVGGMGVVYRATHRLLQQPRALKVLQSHSASDETFLKLFYREARLAASLEHPGIVRVFDVGEADGQHYLAMALLDGRPLHRLLRTEGSVSARRAAAIIRQLADALDYAHARKILHRDVKPSNVFVDANDQVTLLDFGIARAMDGTSSSSGLTLGTVAYMAPELFEGQVATPASDGYALAILAFELLCGKTPFGDMTPHAMGYAHVHRAPPPVRSRRPELPEAVDRAISRQLAKNPAGRFSRAGEFADALVPALRAASLLEMARGAVAAQDIDGAERMLREAEAMIPGDPTVEEVAALARRQRDEHSSRTAVLGRLEAGDWRSASRELDRLDRDGAPGLAALRGRVDLLRRTEEARLAAERQAAVQQPIPHIVTQPDPPSTQRAAPQTGVVPAVAPGIPSRRPTVMRAPVVPPPGRRSSPARMTVAVGIGVVLIVLAGLLWWVLFSGGSRGNGPASPTGTAQPATSSQGTGSRVLVAPPAGPADPARSASSAAAPAASGASDPAARLVEARAALDAGRLEEARTIVDSLRESAPQLSGLPDLVSMVYTRQGKLMAEAGRHPEAQAAFDVALQARPDDADAQAGRRQSVLQQRWDTMEAAWGKDDDAAIAAADEIFNLDPSYRDVREKLYALLMAKGDRLLSADRRSDATAAFQRAHNVLPTGTEATQRLATLTPATAVSRPATQAPAPATQRPIQPVVPAQQPTAPPTDAPQPTARPIVQPAPTATRPPPPPTARPMTPPPPPTPVPTRPPAPAAPAPTQEQTCQQGPHVVLAGPCDVRRPQ